MGLIVIFNEGATPEKVLSVIPSANDIEFVSRTDVVLNPDLSALSGVPRKYWKHVTGSIVEYTAGEKATQDAAEDTAAEARVRADAKDRLDGFDSQSLQLRAFADIIKDELNILRALHSLSDRTLAQLRTSIKNRIDGGTVDS